MNSTRVEEVVGDIEACVSTEVLRHTMQRIAESYGFASYNFLDAAHPHEQTPFYFGTTGKQWEWEYDSNGFVHVDPCVAQVRRSNIPFVWEQLEVPERHKGPRSGIQRLMDAARDFRFTEGLVIPCHFKDRLGRHHSASSVFYWKEDTSQFKRLISSHKHELHLIMVYFIQKCIDLELDREVSSGMQPNQLGQIRTVNLTARERDVLSWAGRGKTIVETGDILSISSLTAETHMKNALRKLDVNNKTHGVAKCILDGLIDV